MRRITLRQARTQRAKLTQVALAQKSGIPQPYISALEVGKIVNPGFEAVLALAAAMDIDPRCLRFGDRDEPTVAA